jgi:DNA (cytosine-5)-methyltransferase 1
MKAVSLFSSAGIGELLLPDTGIEVLLANELIAKRAECYNYFYPETEIVVGDIGAAEVKSRLIGYIKDKNINILIATPPCQGLSTLGKNKANKEMVRDERNYLIYHVFDIIDKCSFDYILIENVSRFLDMKFPFKGNFSPLMEIIKEKYQQNYQIESHILNAKDYGIAQTRPRAIIKLYAKDKKWGNPKKEKEIPLKDAIGHLPSLEAGESSDIKWHNAKKHNSRSVHALKYTPPGQSALKNEVHYPKKANGERIKGFHNTYKRMKWEEPAHARTTYCGSISSHNNVHPGRKLSDGTYSDARVLTLLETFIVSSIPQNIQFPEWANDTFIRTMIGESVPPLLLNKILNGIDK